MNFCNACCCCTQKKTNKELETIPKEKNITLNRSFISGNNDNPVFVINTETDTNEQPIIIQPKTILTQITQDEINTETSSVSAKKILFLETKTDPEKLDSMTIKKHFYISDLPSDIKKYSDETEKIKLNLTNFDIIPENTLKQLRLICLEIHNILRAQHGCPYLRENDELNKIAENRAMKIFENNFEYYEDEKKLYGENYFCTDQSNSPIQVINIAIQSWYDNIKYYDFNKNKGLKTFYHFTQIIWKDTMELGTAVIQKDDNILVICCYNPPGKIKEEINEFKTPEIGTIFRVINEYTKKKIKYFENNNKLFINYNKSITEKEICEYMLPKPINNFRVTNDYIQKNINCIRQSSLDFHNYLRSLHGCQILMQNDKLNKLAKEILDFCEVNGGNINTFPLEKKRFVGHNSSRIRDYELVTVSLAIQNWYDNGKTYDYENLNQDNELNERCFMQIINRDTIAIGTDMRIINDEIWVYCVYYPPRSLNELYKSYLIPRPLSHNMFKTVEMYPEEMRWSCLEAHNRLRELHGCLPLRGNPILDKCAEKWAKHLAEKNKLYYRINIEYGENLFWSSDEYASIVCAVEEWYDEIELYNYNNPELTAQNGHFTQLIWQDTMELGTGVARNDSGVYVVCMYDPPGNILNRINEYYIPQPIFDRQI